MSQRRLIACFAPAILVLMSVRSPQLCPCHLSDLAVVIVRSLFGGISSHLQKHQKMPYPPIWGFSFPIQSYRLAYIAVRVKSLARGIDVAY